jgi:RNA polymerase sigma-70 factor (ECF subfamily)
MTPDTARPTTTIDSTSSKDKEMSRFRPDTTGKLTKGSRDNETVALATDAQLGSMELALEALDFVYAFLYGRVGNRSDAEDLTQEVALRALPRLKTDVGLSAVRSYLFASARSVLADFWAVRLGRPAEELHDDDWVAREFYEPSSKAEDRVHRIIDTLPANYARVLELRFLRGSSLKEVAAELGTTLGAVKVMQLRALRAAARLPTPVDQVPNQQCLS